MCRPRNPTDILLGIERNTCVTVGLVEQLKTIVVDEDIGSTTLSGVCMNGTFEIGNAGCDDMGKGFLVHGHLDSDVREGAVNLFVGSRANGRIVSRILVVLSDGAEAERLND